MIEIFLKIYYPPGGVVVVHSGSPSWLSHNNSSNFTIQGTKLGFCQLLSIFIPVIHLETRE